MSRRRALLVLDACMAALFVVLLSWHLTGLDLHEWLGISLIATILVHLLVHWGWMEARATQVIRRSRMGRGAFALNAGLFAAMGTTLISGVVISKVAAPNRLSPEAYLRWHGIHEQATLFTVLLVGAHLAFNWDRVRSRALAASRRVGESASRRLPQPIALWLLARRAISMTLATGALIVAVWMLVLVMPGSSQVLMIFPDGHRALVAPPAEITRAGPNANHANPGAALPRLVMSIILLAAAGAATRHFIIRRRRRRIGSASRDDAQTVTGAALASSGPNSTSRASRPMSTSTAIDSADAPPTMASDSA